jgi:hypothetical protein
VAASAASIDRSAHRYSAATVAGANSVTFFLFAFPMVRRKT